MNLYLISQTKNNDYDTYDAAVVAAETAEQAQVMHPNHDRSCNDKLRDYTWTSPENVTVKLIGEAVPDTTAGVVLASFNAG